MGVSNSLGSKLRPCPACPEISVILPKPINPAPVGSESNPSEISVCGAPTEMRSIPCNQSTHGRLSFGLYQLGQGKVKQVMPDGITLQSFPNEACVPVPARHAPIHAPHDERTAQSRGAEDSRIDRWRSFGGHLGFPAPNSVRIGKTRISKARETRQVVLNCLRGGQLGGEMPAS